MPCAVHGAMAIKFVPYKPYRLVKHAAAGSGLIGSVGSAPARYSYRLLWPSLSGSHVAHESALVVVGPPKYWSRHQSGMPSPTLSAPHRSTSQIDAPSCGFNVKLLVPKSQ